MENFSRSLRQSFEERPEQVAVRLLYNQRPEQPIPYRGLVLGAARYLRALSEAGIGQGEVVILIFNHGEDLIFSFFGAILHGAVPAIMPFLTEKLSPEQYRASLAALFEVTAPAAVITYPEFREEVEAARRQSPAGASVRILLDSSQVPPTAADFHWDECAGLERSPSDLVLLQHSSGTTGLQKGIALSHQAVFNQIDSYSQALQLDSSDVVVSWLPLYHDMGLIAGFIMPILHHIPLVLMSPFDWVRAPYRLMQAISQHRGTLAWLPNFAYNFCAQKIRSRDLEGVDLSSWRAVINCSEPMHWKSHQMFLERFQAYGFQAQALATCYAMAENVFAVTQGGIDRPVTVDRVDPKAFLTQQRAIPSNTADAIPMLSAGRPIQHTEVIIVAPDGQPLPERHLGEIALRSNCMLSGYYHRPDATAQAFLEGWYLTGDLGYMAQGEVYITGRKKDLIIVGGKNIHPQDLERLAGEVEGVHAGRSVAFGVYNEASGTEDVVLIAEIDGWSGPVEQDDAATIAIADQIRQRVTQGSDISLRQVYLVGRGWLLKTSSGKTARAANRQKWLEESAG